jgi:hypothetical protein
VPNFQILLQKSRGDTQSDPVRIEGDAKRRTCWQVKTATQPFFYMKRSTLKLIVFALAVVFGSTLAARSQSTLILDDTWTNSDFTTWNLPYSSPWYYPDTPANSNYIGVATGSLFLTNYSTLVTKTTYFWTFFTTNDPALSVPMPPGITNIISNTTNALYGHPVQINPGQMIKLTLKFQPDGFIMDSAAKGLRFGLMSYDHADTGRPTRYTSNISKSGTNVTGYFVEVPIWGTITNTGMFSMRVRTNMNLTSDATDPMGKTADYIQLGSGPTLTNVPGFQLDQEYTMHFSVARYAASNLVSADITGPLAGVALTNFSRAYVDPSGSNYFKFDCLMIRGDSGSPVVDNLILNEFKVEVLPITFDFTLQERINEDQFRLRWTSISGFNYQIQSKDDLNSASWTSNATVTATGSSTTWTNAGTTGVNQRFYRIVNTP